MENVMVWPEVNVKIETTGRFFEYSNESTSMLEVVNSQLSKILKALHHKVHYGTGVNMKINGNKVITGIIQN
jgi:hypothetical protein